MKKNLLIIFAKNPVTGSVKTRLAKDIGEQKAKAIYTSILESLIDQNKDQDYDFKIYYSGNKDYFTKFNIPINEQVTNPNLGERMFQAVQFELKNYEKVIIIGSDLPNLFGSTINEAFEKLTHSDIVLGPAIDGGYYLIGMSNTHNVFELEKWSHENVLKDTIKLIEHKALKYELLDYKRDIDTVEDLKNYDIFY